jgi:hypothetical protein
VDCVFVISKCIIFAHFNNRWTYFFLEIRRNNMVFKMAKSNDYRFANYHKTTANSTNTTFIFIRIIRQLVANDNDFLLFFACEGGLERENLRINKYDRNPRTHIR